jgi:hypothetical protein
MTHAPNPMTMVCASQRDAAAGTDDDDDDDEDSATIPQPG